MTGQWVVLVPGWARTAIPCPGLNQLDADHQQDISLLEPWVLSTGSAEDKAGERPHDPQGDQRLAGSVSGDGRLLDNNGR